MSFILAAAVAIAPGIYALVSGRRLIALAEDPTFPDRNLARSRRLGTALICAIISATILAEGGLWWTAPLAIIALVAGCYPARRRLYDEQWGFGTYVRYTIFSAVGMTGFWLLLVVAPSVIGGVGQLDPRGAAAVAATLAILLVLCQANYPAFWRAMHRARPLGRPDLDGPFAEILARTRCTAPTIHRFGQAGGHSMNAVALPHAKQPGVAIGDTLLERLEVDEIAAVFAHEVAHLEHFTRERMRRMALVTWTLILLSTALTAVLTAMAPGHVLWLTLGLLFAALMTLASIAAQSQANETACDLRAVELTGNPDALVRALTKLHTHLHLPRHWPHEQEKSLSHPSLARRIQAIRGRTSDAAPALPQTAVARAPVGGARIALDESRAYWFEGIPDDAADDLATLREQASSYRALAYSDLSELRIVSAGAGKAVKARDLDGHAWLVSIRTEDVPAVQRALEVVDARIGERRTVDRRAGVRMLAVAMLLALAAAGQMGVVLLPLVVALARPSATAVAALGAMAMAGAAAALAAGQIAGPLAVGGTVAMMAIGAVGLWLAWRNRGAPAVERESRPVQLALGAGGVGILLMLAPLALDSSPRTTLAHPLLIALAVTGVGLAATLWTRDERSWRRGGLALAGLASALVLAGAASASALSGPPLVVTDAAATLVKEITLDHAAYRLEVSPDGSRYAVQLASREAADEYGDRSSRWLVATFKGAERSVEAVDLAFLNDGRLLVLATTADDSMELRIESPGTASSRRTGAWRLVLPELIAPALQLDRGAGRWMVTGLRESGEVVAFAGDVSSPALEEHAWPASDNGWMEPLAIGREGGGIAVATRGPRGALQLALSAFTGSAIRFDVLRSNATGWSRVATIDGVPRCSVRGGGAVCLTVGGEHARMVLVSDSGDVRVAGWLPAGYEVRHPRFGDQPVALAYDGASVLVLDPEGASAVRITTEPGGVAATTDIAQRLAIAPSPAGEVMLMDGRVGRGVLATLATQHGRSVIRVYRPR